MLALVLVLVTFLLTVGYNLTLSGFGDWTYSISDLVDLYSDSASTVVDSDIVGYIAYFFPLSGMYVITEFFLTFIVVYTVVVNLYPILKAYVVDRASR